MKIESWQCRIVAFFENTLNPSVLRSRLDGGVPIEVDPHDYDGVIEYEVTDGVEQEYRTCRRCHTRRLTAWRYMGL